MKRILFAVISLSVIAISALAELQRPVRPSHPVVRPPVVVAPPAYGYGGSYYGGNYIAPAPVVGNGCSMHYINNEFVRDCGGSVSRPYYGNGGVVYR